MKGQGDGEKRFKKTSQSRGHARVMELLEATDGNMRETDRLKSPLRRKGSKDCARDRKHLGKMG